MATLQVNVVSTPVPVASVQCLKQSLSCPPFAGGVIVNPTTRLALQGACTDKCSGALSYVWTISPLVGASPLLDVRLAHGVSKNECTVAQCAQIPYFGFYVNISLTQIIQFQLRHPFIH
jgi:hypothetical protein